MSIEGKVTLITGPGHRTRHRTASRRGWGRHRDRRPHASKMGEVADEVRRIARKTTTFVAGVIDREQVYVAVAHAAAELWGGLTNSRMRLRWAVSTNGPAVP